MQPSNKEEFLQRFNENQKLSGFGLETTMHVPCPFCAAPDFMVYKIIDSAAAMARGGTCNVCDRSMKAIFDRKPGVTSFTIVQTGGPDQPEWLEPKIPRA